MSADRCNRVLDIRPSGELFIKVATEHPLQLPAERIRQYERSSAWAACRSNGLPPQAERHSLGVGRAIDWRKVLAASYLSSLT